MPIARALVIHLVMRNDLILRFLQLHQLAKLVGLARLSLADDLRLWLKYAEQLSRKLGHPSKIRDLVCRTTRPTRSTIVSSRSLKWHTFRRRRGGSASTSCNTRRESWRICRVTPSSCRYSLVRFSSPSGPLWRKA